MKKWLEVEDLVLIDIGHTSMLFLIKKVFNGCYLIEVPKQFFTKASLDINTDGLDNFMNQISLHVDNLNNLKKAPSRGFLAQIPRFSFNIDGTIRLVK